MLLTRQQSPTRTLDTGGSLLLFAFAAGLGISELLRPFRRRAARRLERWPTNAVLGVGAGVVERVLVVSTLAAVSRYCARRRIGLLHHLHLRAPIRAAIGLLALDAGMYLWHRMNHQLPALWRFHAVHHTDLDLDLSTAARLHPGELLSSIPVRSAQLFVIGPSERTVIAYELLMQLASMFYHSDLDLGARADAVAGRLLMTPRLHTRHHSATRAERDCNWGVVSSIWDRLFGTFDARAARDPRLGVGSERKIEALHLRRLLSLPRRSRFD